MTTAENNAQITADQLARLAPAYEELHDKLGRPPGAEKLRKETNVSAGAARAYISQRRNEAALTEMPKDTLRLALEPFTDTLLTSVWQAARKITLAEIPAMVKFETDDTIADMQDLVDAADKAREAAEAKVTEAEKLVETTRKEAQEARDEARKVSEQADLVPALEDANSQLERDLAAEKVVNTTLTNVVDTLSNAAANRDETLKELLAELKAFRSPSQS